MLVIGVLIFDECTLAKVNFNLRSLDPAENSLSRVLSLINKSMHNGVYYSCHLKSKIKTPSHETFGIREPLAIAYALKALLLGSKQQITCAAFPNV